jgi:hypothetical protein
MPNRFLLCAVSWVSVVPFVIGRSPAFAASASIDPTEKKIGLSLAAGRHDRLDFPLSVLIDAGKAASVFVEYPDGSLGRAQLVEPGIGNAAGRGTGKKELHFLAPKMAKGEILKVVAKLSAQPVEGRTYVWTGEPRQSRRLSCGQCHQGLAVPTGDELRQERKVMEETGKPPPLNLPRILPTSKGRDFRWHAKLGRYQTSACWECHARHMVQYEFGQSIDRDLPWAPDPAQAECATQPPAVGSVFYRVFRTRRDRAVSHPLQAGSTASIGAPTWAIHYGFQRATVGARACSDVLQQHGSTLSEEAGKFIGRHCVLIDWVGKIDGRRTTIAREERQLTVKDLRGRNGSYAMWIDFASMLRPAAGPVRLDGSAPLGGFRFVPSVDAGTAPEYRESNCWRASTFVSEATTYTAVCFNHSSNPEPLPHESAHQNSDRGPLPLVGAIGYRFSAGSDGQKPILVHYRLWIQGGRMPDGEIRSLADDFREPIRIEVK